VLVLKTREVLLPALEKAVKEVHRYSCPCILALPVVHASKEYEEWILGETRDA
jgi:periplasmic divalent cation tolerance protein